ncbi:MAG: hypothetical protein QOG65_2786 [Actinomycetota bacterium]|nr:hypothetical protein [Actinomycetota bacterium]
MSCSDSNRTHRACERRSHPDRHSGDGLFVPSLDPPACTPIGMIRVYVDALTGSR